MTVNAPEVDRSFLARLRSGVHKLGWGVRTVGIGATLQGAIRLMRLQLQRPRGSEVKLRSGPCLEFDYPSQYPVMLVLFGDLVDPEFAFLRQISKPEWIVADVGAAIGQFAIFAATLPAAKVHAFEPSNANVATLRRNVAKNNVSDKVIVHKLALSNTDGEAFFETAKQNWMSGLSSVPTIHGEAVRVRTLTEELRRLKISHLGVLKINVSGFEPEVIEGAEDFLAGGGAAILILLLGLASLPWYDRLSGYGYRFFYYHPGERGLYEVTAFDPSSVLDHRPWPARHIIAIHETAMADCVGDIFKISQL